MTKLVTLAQAKQRIRLDHTLDDADINLMIDAASGAVLQYIGDTQYQFLDTGGDLVDLDPATEQAAIRALHVVKQATLVLITDWDKNRDGVNSAIVDPKWGYGYLPRPVVAILYPLRDPTIA